MEYGSSDFGADTALVALFLLLGGYFLPFIIALVREHPRKGAIFVLNLFAGWTLFGWVAAMVWALISNPKEIQ